MSVARRLTLVWGFIVLVTHAWLFLQSPPCPGPSGGLDCMAFARYAGALGAIAGGLLIVAWWMAGRSPWVRALVSSAALVAAVPAAFLALLAGAGAWRFGVPTLTLGVVFWTGPLGARPAIPAGVASAAGLHAVILLFARSRGEARHAPLAVVAVLLAVAAVGAVLAWRARR